MTEHIDHRTEAEAALAAAKERDHNSEDHLAGLVPALVGIGYALLARQYEDVEPQPGAARYWSGARLPGHVAMGLDSRPAEVDRDPHDGDVDDTVERARPYGLAYLPDTDLQAVPGGGPNTLTRLKHEAFTPGGAA